MPETLKVSELIQALSQFPPNARVYCNERGRYDDKRLIMGVNAFITNSSPSGIGNIAMVEYSNV